MGKFFSQPGSALMDPQSGRPTFIGNPNQVLSETNRLLQQQGITTLVPPELQGLVPNKPNAPLPSIGTPSFREAVQAGAPPGGANILSPGLNKAGKLATLLMSGLQGAMAGRAASEQAVIQSGGRRSGGPGIGFEAGYMLPWQRAMQKQQLQQAQAQTALTEAQSQMVPTPYGQMPAGLAKLMFPAMIRAG